MRLLPYIFGASTVFIFCGTSLADRVYRWEDDTGVVHYSNQQPAPHAKPHELPEIMRGEVKIAELAGFSCVDHGGINCQAGPDKDGSVICFDGFSEASTRFRFTCNSPKLEIAEVSEVAGDGKFTVFVRNANSVPANNVALTFTAENGEAVQLNGPAELDPFGAGEFTFKIDAGENAPKQVTLAQLLISCSNCQ